MKIVSARILSLALAIGVAPVALAQQRSPAPPDKPVLMQSLEPPGYLDRLDWMAGTWQCQGKQQASELGPAHAYRATLQIDRRIRGWWWSTHLAEKTSEYTAPIEVQGYIGFEPKPQKYVRIELMSGGARVETHSKGFKGDRLVFTGDAYLGGKRVGYRQAFTKQSIDALSLSSEIGGPEANRGWSQFRQASCKRAVAEAGRKRGT